MRAITHGLGTAVLLVATAFFTLVQIAHVDQAFQRIGGRDSGSSGTERVSLVSNTDPGHGSKGHGQRGR